MAILDQQQTSTDTSGARVFATRNICQTVTAGIGGVLNKVSIYLASSGNQGGAVVSIVGTSDGVPNSADVLWTQTFDDGSFDSGWNDIDTSTDAPEITAGTVFGIQFTNSDTSLGEPDFILQAESEDNLYANGSVYENRRAGWVTITVNSVVKPNYDLMFKTYVNVPSVSTGAIVLSGKDTVFKKTLNLISSVRTYALTGKTSVLNRGYAMMTSVGSFALTGINNILKLARGFNVTTATYVLGAKTILVGRRINLYATTATYILTGISANIARTAYFLVTQTRNYALSGYNTVMYRVYNLVGSVRTYSLTGISILTNAGKWFTAGTGNITLTLNNVIITGARSVIAFTAQFISNFSGVVFSGSGSWTLNNEDKPTTTITNTDKGTPSITNSNKISSNITNISK